MSPELSDNGQGISPRALAQAQATEGNGMGLVSMQERVELTQGNFSVGNAPGSGMIITCKWDRL